MASGVGVGWWEWVEGVGGDGVGARVGGGRGGGNLNLGCLLRSFLLRVPY